MDKGHKVESRELEEALGLGASLLARSSYLVALVGAGLSVESGIPPFRGPQGLWTRFGEPDMQGYQRFLEDPAGWWHREVNEPEAYLLELRKAIAQAQPNPGHYALAELERIDVLKYVITQNVDNLHQRAGSQRVAEVHGNRTKLRCLNCHLRIPREGFPVTRYPPRCPQCGGVIKVDSVMFGEPIPQDVLEVCLEETGRCDCMLLIGTSATVYPAAGFATQAKANGAALVEINVHPSALSQLCDAVMQGPAGEVLPRLLERVKELMGTDAP